MVPQEPKFQCLKLAERLGTSDRVEVKLEELFLASRFPRSMQVARQDPGRLQGSSFGSMGVLMNWWQNKIDDWFVLTLNATQGI